MMSADRSPCRVLDHCIACAVLVEGLRFERSQELKLCRGLDKEHKPQMCTYVSDCISCRAW